MKILEKRRKNKKVFKTAKLPKIKPDKWQRFVAGTESKISLWTWLTRLAKFVGLKMKVFFFGKK